MIPALVVALLLAPLYWWLTPAAWRREVVTGASLVGLAVYDPRLVVVLLLGAIALSLLLRAMGRLPSRIRWGIAWAVFALLAVVFVWNKKSGDAAGALASQGGLVLLGFSYLALKVAAILATAARGRLGDFRWPGLLAWIVFLPTYPSGPIERFEHFDSQRPAAEGGRVGIGLERILFGLVKALVFAHWLGVYAEPILAAPGEYALVERWLAVWAFVLRFYFDFAGASDVAIGLAAVYGFEIAENFDRPLLQRNLVRLWQRWHMTLTAWLRAQLFTPIGRGLMRAGGGRFDVAATVVAQVVTMTFCGLWHGVSWNFALWGLLQAVGLIAVGVLARRIGATAPRAWVDAWHANGVVHALCVFATFNYFALTSLLLHSTVANAVVVLRSLVPG